MLEVIETTCMSRAPWLSNKQRFCFSTRGYYGVTSKTYRPIFEVAVGQCVAGEVKSAPALCYVVVEGGIAAETATQTVARGFLMPHPAHYQLPVGVADYAQVHLDALDLRQEPRHVQGDPKARGLECLRDHLEGRDSDAEVIAVVEIDLRDELGDT